MPGPSQPGMASSLVLGGGEEYHLVNPDVRLYDVGTDLNIVVWRVGCFECAGFDHGDAMILAVRRDVDRDEVERLLTKGATHGQVLALVT